MVQNIPENCQTVPLHSFGNHSDDAQQMFQKQGFYIVPDSLIPEDHLQKALREISPVINGFYETGTLPWRLWNVGHPFKVQKIDMAHLCNRTFFELSTHPAIGEWASKITGASEIQLWSVQLFYKPPGGGRWGNIGWHTDQSNWLFWKGEVFTAWLALDIVDIDCGPLLFVDGSHLWEPQHPGNAYIQDLDSLRTEILKGSTISAEWHETPVLLPAGGVSFHQSRLLHGSGPNHSSKPRCSLAISFRTPNSEFIQKHDFYGFGEALKNPSICPIVYKK